MLQGNGDTDRAGPPVGRVSDRVEQDLLGWQIRENGAVDLVRRWLGDLTFINVRHDVCQNTMFEMQSEGLRLSPATVAARIATVVAGTDAAVVFDFLDAISRGAPVVPSPNDLECQIRSSLNALREIRSANYRQQADELLRARGIEAMEDAVALVAQAAPGRALPVFSATSLAGIEVPLRRELVRDLIPSRNVTLLAGDGGTGKSLLALQLCASTSLSKKWLGREVLEPGPVIYFTAEDERDEVHRRLADVLADLGATFEQAKGLNILSLAGCDALLGELSVDGKILPTNLFTEIEAHVALIRPTLVVVDTLADVFPGEENNRSQARQFVNMLRGPAVRHDTTLLLLAHPSLTGMSSRRGTSGSTGWSNSVRSRLYFERVKDRNDNEDDPDLRVLRCKKANYGPAGLAIPLRWRGGVFTPALPTESVTTMAAQAKAERIFLEILRTYIAEGRNVGPNPSANFAPAVFAKDERSSGIGKHLLTDAMNRLFSKGTIRAERFGPASRQTTRIVPIDNGK